MTAQVIPRDKLGELTKIGQGGQGVVYAAPNVKTKFAASMVFKEYKPQTLAEIDFTALAAMPALVEDSLSYAQGERLISFAAWPCALVENTGATAGFVMPAIPQEFFIPLTTVKGVSTCTAEFQHLLNHPTVLVARGIDIDDAQRYALLREVAASLAFLHRHGVCVGDISPKNLLFSLAPREAVYFIDCDAVRINGVSALRQVESPGWAAPAGEELATIYTDTYKLGLLALRLLAGDQDTTNPDHLPSTTPDRLRQIITDTLKRQPVGRPLPEAWTYVLGDAIEHAQHRITASAVAAPVSAGLPAPPVPEVRSRPTAGTGRPVRPSVPAPPTPVSPSRPPVGLPPPPKALGKPRSQQPVKFLAPGLLIVAFVAVYLPLLAISGHVLPVFSVRTFPLVFPLLRLVCWLVLALAFALVAIRCRGGRRATAVTAWLTCAAAVVPALAAAYSTIEQGWYSYYIPGQERLASIVVFLALIALGGAASKPFGGWWSVPTMFTGLLGILGFALPMFFYRSFGPLVGHFSQLIWLLALLLLGIAMCRTRAHAVGPSASGRTAD